MAKKFDTLRAKMSSEARARAAQRAWAMFGEMAPPEVEIHSNDCIHESEQGEADLAKAFGRRDRSHSKK